MNSQLVMKSHKHKQPGNKGASLGRALIIINPISGTGSARAVQKKLERHFQHLGWIYTTYLTTGKEDLRHVVRVYLQEPYNLVVAAGGDGTVSQVASGMAHTDIPLGVIPMGTWNALARNLGIPMIHDLAIRLLTGRHATRKLDALNVNGTLYLLNVSIGISSSLINLTDRQSKRRFGFLAYFKNFFIQLFGLRQRNYQLIIDQKQHKVRATELMIANSGLVGIGELPTRLNIHPDDGVIETCIMNPRSIFDLANIAWNVLFWRTRTRPRFRCLPVTQSISIRSARPAIVQGDGEIIGKTPVDIKVVPGAVSIIVPQDELKQIIQRLLEPEGILKFQPNIDLKELTHKIPALKHIYDLLTIPREHSQD